MFLVSLGCCLAHADLLEILAQVPQTSSLNVGTGVEFDIDTLGDSVGCATHFASWTGAGGPDCRPPLSPAPWNLVQQNKLIIAALDNITQAAQLVMKQIHDGPLNLTTALSIVVVYGQDVIYNQGFGAVDLNKPTQVPDGDTIYNIGSITKVFSSLLMLHAHEEGKLSLDDRVDKYFNNNTPPAWGVRNPYSTSAANVAPSLRSLAGQVSGLPREPPCGVYNPPACTEAVIMQALADYYSLIAPPFSTPHYSNLGFAVLGRAVERAMGGRYEVLLPQLLASLGMNRTGFQYSPEIQARMATGYHVTDVGGPQTVGCCNTQELGWPSPAGGMYSSPNDIAQFFKQLFTGSIPLYQPKNNNKRNKKSLKAGGLSPELIADFFRGGNTNSDGVTGYSLAGWETFYSAGWPVFTKGGLVDAYAGSLSVVPGLQLGVGVFLNINSGLICNNLGAYFTNTLTAAFNATLTALQKPPPLPGTNRLKLLLGDYGTQGTKYFSIYLQPDNSLTGHVFSYGNVTFIWDPVQDSLGGAVVALRFRLMGANSCPITQGLADNGFLYVVTEAQPPSIIAPDLKIFMMPKV